MQQLLDRALHDDDSLTGQGLVDLHMATFRTISSDEVKDQPPLNLDDWLPENISLDSKVDYMARVPLLSIVVIRVCSDY